MLAAALISLLISQSPTADPSLFTYDAARPLDVRETSRREDNGVLLRDITYAALNGGTNAATLITPKAPPPQRGRRPANTTARRRPVVASIAADPEDGSDPAVFTDTGEAAPRSATASAGRSRTGTGNAPGRGRGGGGGPRRG